MEYNKNFNSHTKINMQIKRLTSQYLYNIKYTGWHKKNVLNFCTALCNTVININEGKSTFFSEQTSPNKCKNFA